MYHYVLGESETLPMGAIPTWCFDCDGIWDSEHLPCAEYLKTWLEELRTNGLDQQSLEDKARFLRIDLDLQHEFERELARREAAVQWRTERAAPPRCLNCGGTNHSPIESPEREIQHPGCTGVFRSTLSFHSVQSVYWKVDTNGHRLVSSGK